MPFPHRLPPLGFGLLQGMVQTFQVFILERKFRQRVLSCGVGLIAFEIPESGGTVVLFLQGLFHPVRIAGTHLFGSFGKEIQGALEFGPLVLKGLQFQCGLDQRETVTLPHGLLPLGVEGLESCGFFAQGLLFGLKRPDLFIRFFELPGFFQGGGGFLVPLQGGGQLRKIDAPGHFRGQDRGQVGVFGPEEVIQRPGIPPPQLGGGPAGMRNGLGSLQGGDVLTVGVQFPLTAALLNPGMQIEVGCGGLRPQQFLNGGGGGGFATAVGAVQDDEAFRKIGEGELPVRHHPGQPPHGKGLQADRSCAGGGCHDRCSFTARRVSSSRRSVSRSSNSISGRSRSRNSRRFRSSRITPSSRFRRSGGV